jgi:hypothetical protein
MINSILENKGFRPRFKGREGSIFPEESIFKKIYIYETETLFKKINFHFPKQYENLILLK